MKVSELTTWIDDWFDTGLTLDRVSGTWGRVVPGANEVMPAIEPLDPRFARVNLELLRKPPEFVSGLVAVLSAPEKLRWDQVKARFGDSHQVLSWDRWNSPDEHSFRLEKNGMRGALLLAIRPSEGPVVDIEHLAIRRFPPGGLAP